MTTILTRAKIQSWNNFTYALRMKDLGYYVNLIDNRNIIKEDRIILVCVDNMEEILDNYYDFTRDRTILKKAHPNAYASWRENVTMYSMQICLLYNNCYMIEVDCDYGRPFYDVVGWSIHASEVLYNKITGHVTNPFRVRDAWNKRGYKIPLAV